MRDVIIIKATLLFNSTIQPSYPITHDQAKTIEMNFKAPPLHLTNLAPNR